MSERIAFVMRLLPGAEAEYRERHLAVWPELLADLREAGATNYSIYLRDSDLFAYLEVDDFAHFTERMSQSEANARWQADMARLIDPLTDPATGFHARIPEVFHLE